MLPSLFFRAVVPTALATTTTTMAVAATVVATIPLPTLVHGSLMRYQRRKYHNHHRHHRSVTLTTTTSSLSSTLSMSSTTPTTPLYGRLFSTTSGINGTQDDNSSDTGNDGTRKKRRLKISAPANSRGGGRKNKKAAAAAGAAAITTATGDGSNGDGDHTVDDIDNEGNVVDDVDASSLLQTLAQVQELVATSSSSVAEGVTDDSGNGAFEMPKIVSIGNQSAGKSSVCAALLGIDLFPTGSNMVTRRPLELTLLRSRRGEAVYGQFGAYGDKIYDVAELTRRIVRANAEVAEEVNGAGVSTEPIRLTISSPTVLPMVLVDVPGYIAVTKHGQRDDLPEQIEQMCDAYVRDPNYIKLVVMAATVDRANSLALAKLKRAGQMHNAFGVLTKLDLVTNGGGSSSGDSSAGRDVVFGSNNDKVTDMLTDADYAPGLGLVGVVMRTSQEQDAGVSIAQSIVAEHRHFVRHGLIVDDSGSSDSSSDGDASLTVLPKTTQVQLLHGNGVADGVKLGVPFLQQALSREHLRKTAASIPSLVSQLDDVIARAKSNSSLLSQLAKQPDLDVISRELGKILDDMSAWSPRRRAFELQLNSALQTLIRDTVHDSFAVVSTQSTSRKAPTLSTSSLTSPTSSKLLGDDLFGRTTVNQAASGYTGGSSPPSVSSIDLNAMRGNLRATRHFHKRSNAADRQYDEYVVYGKCSAQANQYELDQVHTRAFGDIDGVGMVPFVRQTVSSDTAAMRVAWNEQLERVVDHMLRRQCIAVRARQLCIDEILCYVNRTAACGSGSDSDCADTKLVHHFFGYLVEKISERTSNTQLIFSIEQALLREKRPATTFAGLSAALVRRQVLAHPQMHEHMLSYTFLSETYPRNVAMYSDAWSQAYYDVMIRRVELDIFRMIAVNLLDPLIQHCLNLSLTFFQGLNVSAEEQQMAQRVTELGKIRAKLLTYKRMQL